MKKSILLLTLFATMTSFSQIKELALINKKNKDTTFLYETRRIKVWQENGTKIGGKFKILNDSTLIIKNDTIKLSKIIKLRKASSFSSVAEPLFTSLGAIGIGGAVAAVNDKGGSGYGGLVAILLLVPSIPMTIIPQITNYHKKEDWDYKIINVSN